MIKIEDIKLYGEEAAIRGMRNPMNSWKMSDSIYDYDKKKLIYGEKDLKLMRTLCTNGSEHRKFMRMMTVTMDVTAPLYWWKEFDTYKVGTVSNSCSTMHKLASRDLYLDDFSTDHLTATSKSMLSEVLKTINNYRKLYKDDLTNKDAWWQMIQLLPSSYNQKRTISTNLEVLFNIYYQREHHKLDEWHVFCETIENEIPIFSKLINFTSVSID